MAGYPSFCLLPHISPLFGSSCIGCIVVSDIDVNNARIRSKPRHGSRRGLTSQANATSRRGLTQVLATVKIFFPLLVVTTLTACNALREHEVSVLASARSPDGSHVGVAYVDMGGGAAGWCYVCTDVVEGEFNSSSAMCRQSQQWFRCSATMSLKWATPHKILVTYSGEPATVPVPATQPAPSSPSIAMDYQQAP